MLKAKRLSALVLVFFLSPICIVVEPRSCENHVHNNSASQNMKKIYFCSYCGALPFTIRAASSRDLVRSRMFSVWFSCLLAQTQRDKSLQAFFDRVNQEVNPQVGLIFGIQWSWKQDNIKQMVRFCCNALWRLFLCRRFSLFCCFSSARAETMKTDS